jgi:hypothetical protein
MNHGEGEHIKSSPKLARESNRPKDNTRTFPSHRVSEKSKSGPGVPD